MHAKNLFRALIPLVAALTWSGLVSAQDTESQSFTLGEISLRLTNIAVVAGEPTTGGNLPEQPISLPTQQLLPPGSMVWITFDYETDFQKSDAPEGSQFLAVGLEIPQGKHWGYGPAAIESSSGKGAVRLHLTNTARKVLEFDEPIKLTAYTRRNNGQHESATSETAIPVQCRIDGAVTLSLTEYKALQAMRQHIATLEKRVRMLEQKTRSQ